MNSLMESLWVIAHTPAPEMTWRKFAQICWDPAMEPELKCP